MKINVDAALSKNSGISSAAAVARDKDGNFLGASALVVNGITDPEIIEAIACREGLALASDLVLQKFRLACDNSNVIRSIREAGLGAYGHIVQEIRARAREFRTTEFVHENRASNVDAHNLARNAIYAGLGLKYKEGLSSPLSCPVRYMQNREDLKKVDSSSSDGM
ncbi:hypothetical protein EJB05_19722, partial [Eragrostis curvula]